MKIVVAGGHGLVGSKLVDRLQLKGHEVVAASRRTGVDTVTRRNLSDALRLADVVVDVTNSPSFDEPEVTEFFRRSSENLLAAAAWAGVGHFLALSVVGTAKLQDSPYFRAKSVQERLVSQSRVPHTLVRATQFYEFMANIIPPGGPRDPVRLSPALVQPVAADDVADILADLVEEGPLETSVEIAGPERHRLCDLVQWVMYSYQDDRIVVADPSAPYYGALLDSCTLTAQGDARLGAAHFGAWLDGYLTGAVRPPVARHPVPI